MTTPRPAPPYRLASTVLTLVVPLLLAVVAVVVALSWRDRLPDPVAVHWPASGGPDGFGSFTEALVVPLAFLPLFAGGMWALAFFAGHETLVRRIAAASSLGLAAMMTVITVGILAAQLDLADARDTGPVDVVLGLGLLAGAVGATAGALLVRRNAPAPATGPVDPTAPRADLSPTERAVWSRTVTSRGGAWVGGAAVLMSTTLAIGTPVMLVVPVGLGLLLAAMLVVRVTVDTRGLVARSPLGWPTVRIPLDEVVAARAAEVNPLGEFGGWGYRVATDGRVGLVMRKGDAIVVERTAGRVVVVTVDDAAQGAALLNTLADRARGGATAR